MIRAQAIAACFAFAGLGHAAPRDAREFQAVRDEIQLLTVERVRAAPPDHQRALVTAETRLKDLHRDYQVAGSTPPSPLEGDLNALRAAAQKMRVLRSRGRPAEPDPRAAPLIERHWAEYDADHSALLDRVAEGKAGGVSESALYWEATGRFETLKAETRAALVHNDPPGDAGLERTLARDEWALLKRLEVGRKKTRGAGRCVTAREEHPRPPPSDVGPFYNALDLLPAVLPADVGAFTVPPGCRTVTRREKGVKVVVRVTRGRGVAHVGSSEAALNVGYLAVPPDTAYYFENTDDLPLELDYITLGDAP